MNLNIYADMIALISVCIIGVACKKKVDRSHEYRLFFAMIVAIAAALFTDMLSCVFEIIPSRAPLVYTLISLYFLFRVVYSYLWLLFTIALCSGVKMKRRRAVLLFIPALMEIALLFANFRTGWLFTFDHTGYARGVLYWPHLIIFGFYIAGSIVTALYWRGRSQDTERKQQCLYSLLYLFLPLCGAVLEVYNSDISWTFPFAALSQLMMYLHFREHEETMLQRQLTQNRINIMLSQIQPHFLYNALTAIAQLCEKDPKKARETTLQFSEHLRRNMNALTVTEPIPFETELSHVKTYLSIEQARFGEYLHVAYDIETTDFEMPPLCLQPLVENAVRHGVGMREDGGTVHIRTRELPDGYEITVLDDGVGFDPQQIPRDSKAHIGIQNVRERLRRLIGADIRVASQIGRGTDVRIRIPKKEAAL